MKMIVDIRSLFRRKKPKTDRLHFNRVRKLDFDGQVFAFTGFTKEEEKEMSRQIVLRGGMTVSWYSGDADYLIVSRRVKRPTPEYRQAQTLRFIKGEEEVDILSESVFKALLSSCREAILPGGRAPAGGGRLVFKKTLWASLGLTEQDRQELEKKIRRHGGTFTDLKCSVPYLVYDPDGITEADMNITRIGIRDIREEWKETQRREAEGSLTVMPLSVFKLWEMEKANADDLSRKECVAAAEHYLTHPADWANSLNGAQETVGSLLETYHADVAEILFGRGDDTALFLLFDRLCARERDWVKNGISDETYVCSLFAGYFEKVMTGNGKSGSLSDPGSDGANGEKERERRQRYLEYMNRHFAPGLAAKAEQLRADYAFGTAKYPPVYLSFGMPLRFGRYPQAANGRPGPIEWTVLRRKEDAVLLISRYALDFRQYHGERKRISWEKSDLRAWLNGAFLQKAFSPEEQKAILPVQTKNSRRGLICKDRDTQDRVFLLSDREAVQWIGFNEARRCAPTPYALTRYAKQTGRKRVEKADSVRWWLRFPGKKRKEVLLVTSYGIICSELADDKREAVRPAMWVSVPALPKQEDGQTGI